MRANEAHIRKTHLSVLSYVVSHDLTHLYRVKEHRYGQRNRTRPLFHVYYELAWRYVESVTEGYEITSYGYKANADRLTLPASSARIERKWDYLFQMRDRHKGCAIERYGLRWRIDKRPNRLIVVVATAYSPIRRYVRCICYVNFSNKSVYFLSKKKKFN